MIFKIKIGKINLSSLNFLRKNMTRTIQKTQLGIGQTTISEIKFDLKSRDDIPKILKGLQYIYMTDSLREPIFRLLEEKWPPWYVTLENICYGCIKIRSEL